MLRIAKLGAGGEGYYLKSVGPEPPGTWLGKGPAGAGLAGEVGGAELESLLAGRDPHSGEVLGSARNRVKITGFDLTFAAPKSVSILHALSDPSVSEAVAESHRAAVSAAVDYVEDRALGVRRQQGSERIVQPVEGAFGAAFVHRTSRALDPHLHSHVVVANLGRGTDDRFSALDGRGIYAHAGAVGAVYHAQLRHEMVERLGVAGAARQGTGRSGRDRHGSPAGILESFEADRRRSCRDRPKWWACRRTCGSQDATAEGLRDRSRRICGQGGRSGRSRSVSVRRGSRPYWTTERCGTEAPARRSGGHATTNELCCD